MHHSQLYRPDVIEAAAVPSTSEPASQAGIYSHDTDRHRIVWAAETQTFIEEGKAIFHDAKTLGATIGVSCDMCHPDASNTHPETSPNYQVRRQRVDLLRDMINWCIGNPVKGVPFDDSDRRLRALEAYSFAQPAGGTFDLGMALYAVFARGVLVDAPYGQRIDPLSSLLGHPSGYQRRAFKTRRCADG